jgi:hypothetical protein
VAAKIHTVLGDGKDATSQRWLQWWQREKREGKDKGDRGVVMCAGGAVHFAQAYLSISTIRRELKCDSSCMPIDVVYAGPFEMLESMRRLLEDRFQVRVIDAFTLTPPTHLQGGGPASAEDGLPLEGMRLPWAKEGGHPVPMLLRTHLSSNGFPLKVYALLCSRFRHTLLLDADSVPLMRPSAIFDLAQRTDRDKGGGDSDASWNGYSRSGHLFWPDLLTSRDAGAGASDIGLPSDRGDSLQVLLEGLGLTVQDVRSMDRSSSVGADAHQHVDAPYPAATDSGQVLVDSWHPLVWRGVVATWLLNSMEVATVHSFVLGDKDTYRIGWALASLALTRQWSREQTREGLFVFEQVARSPQILGLSGTIEQALGSNEGSIVFCGVAVLQQGPTGSVFVHHTLAKRRVDAAVSLAAGAEATNNRGDAGSETTVGEAAVDEAIFSEIVQALSNLPPSSIAFLGWRDYAAEYRAIVNASTISNSSHRSSHAVWHAMRQPKRASVVSALQRGLDRRTLHLSGSRGGDTVIVKLDALSEMNGPRSVQVSADPKCLRLPSSTERHPSTAWIADGSILAKEWTMLRRVEQGMEAAMEELLTTAHLIKINGPLKTKDGAREVDYVAKKRQADYADLGDCLMQRPCKIALDSPVAVGSTEEHAKKHDYGDPVFVNIRVPPSCCFPAHAHLCLQLRQPTGDGSTELVSSCVSLPKPIGRRANTVPSAAHNTIMLDSLELQGLSHLPGTYALAISIRTLAGLYAAADNDPDHSADRNRSFPPGPAPVALSMPLLRTFRVASPALTFEVSAMAGRAQASTLLMVSTVVALTGMSDRLITPSIGGIA